MSTGRQGSNSRRSSCISKGGARRVAGGGVDARAEALELRAQLGRPAPPPRARRSRRIPSVRISRSTGSPSVAGDLGDPAARPRGGRSPSARAGPGRGRSPGRSRGRRAGRPRRGERPSGRAAPAPCRSARRARSSPSPSAAAAAPAGARGRPRRPRASPAPAAPARTPACAARFIGARVLAAQPACCMPDIGHGDGSCGSSGPPAAVPRPRAFRGGPPSPSPPSAAAPSGRRPRPWRAGRRGSARPLEGGEQAALAHLAGARRIRRAWPRAR